MVAGEGPLREKGPEWGEKISCYPVQNLFSAQEFSQFRLQLLSLKLHYFLSWIKNIHYFPFSLPL